MILIRALVFALSLQCALLAVISIAVYWPAIRLVAHDWRGARLVAGLIYDGSWNKFEFIALDGKIYKG